MLSNINLLYCHHITHWLDTEPGTHIEYNPYKYRDWQGRQSLPHNRKDEQRKAQAYEDSHKAGYNCVPIVRRSCFAYEDRVEYEVT